MNRNEYLKNKVLYFIQKGKEGNSWDFKLEWHEKAEELLKDIICFANTIHDDDCYIIFGITDNLKIKGMRGKRRKQADIINLIDGHDFAGSLRPKVSVDTIKIQGKKLDILTIFNSNMTPYYLKKNFGGMYANCIYLRKEDTNTPDKSSADYYDIEKLWMKRFHLLGSKLDFIINNLDKNDWKYVDEKYFYIKDPQYTIEFCDEEIVNEPDYYSYNMVNSTSYYGELYLCLQKTTLLKLNTVVLDGGRLEIIVPEVHYFYRDKFGLSPKYLYKYYIEDSYNYKLLKFIRSFTDNEESNFAFKKLKEVILIFKSFDEKNSFDKYINSHINTFKKELKNLSEKFYNIDCNNEQKKLNHIKDLNTGKALNKMLEQWRNNNNNNTI